MNQTNQGGEHVQGCCGAGLSSSQNSGRSSGQPITGRDADAVRHAGQRDREAMRHAEDVGQTGQRASAKDVPLTGSQLPSRPFAAMNAEREMQRETPGRETPGRENPGRETPGRDAGQAARRAGAETSDGAELTKPATERQVDDAVKESFPASDPTSTQREKPGAGDAPPDLRHRLPPHGTDAEREAVQQVRDGE